MHRRDQSEIGPAEHRHEMGRRKGQHQIIAHVLHRLGHHVYQVAVIVDRVGGCAIGPARSKEQNQEARHQRAEERPGLLVPRIAFCARPIGQ